MLRILLAMTLSLALYWLLFGTVVHRPLTRGIIFDLLAAKTAHLEAETAPQIVILAGSNARFSHSCATLAAALDRPCTNMGIAAGMGLDLLLASTLARLRPGDLVYMPLEYGQYGTGTDSMLASVETAEWFHRDPRGLLGARGWRGLLYGAFGADLSTGIRGGFEMVFSAMGGRRRFGTQTVNVMGDETGHTPEKGQEYRAVLATATVVLPAADQVFGRDERAGASGALIRFIAAARSRGARVVGGLPTTPDRDPVPEALIREIRDFYRRNGAEFLLLANRSRYPVGDFYDTVYHLNAPAARRHSAALADALRAQGLVSGPAEK